MSETASHKKRRMILGVGGILASTVAIASCGGLASSSTTSRAEAPPTPAKTEPLNRSNAKLLEVGEKISSVRMLTPRVDQFKTFHLKPTTTNSTQDLCLIYAPDESKVLTSSLPNTENDSIGFLVTSSSGRIALSLVTFNAKTKIVDDISPSVGLGKRKQELFAFVADRQATVPNTLAKGYTVFVDPANIPRDGVEIDFLPIAVVGPQPTNPPDSSNE